MIGKDSGAGPSSRGRWATAWVTIVLAASAAVAIGYRAAILPDVDDNEALESVLLMPIARQLTAGPSGLYGPFGRGNPWVLIHAPLYYRLAALIAWPLTRAGVGPIAAAWAAGRGLSFVAFLGLLAAAARLARVDGAAARVGGWSACLIAGSHALGAFPAAVRPDTRGLALRTAGIALTLSAVRGGAGRPGRVEAAGAAFALAFCVKQHLVAAAAVSAVLLTAAALRGRIPARALLRGGAIAAAVVLSIYGVETAITGGHALQAAFVTAAEVGRLRPAGWGRAELVFSYVASWSSGLVALDLAAALALVASRPGRLRRAFVIAAGAAALAITGALIALGEPPLGSLPVGKVLALVALLLACALVEPRGVIGGRPDAALWLYWLAECVLAAALCRASTGSWANYTMPAIVLGSILTARALGRALDRDPPAYALIPAAVASVLVLALVVADARADRRERGAERDRLEWTTRRLGADPRDVVFFVDRPGANRVRGRAELVYDYWLYPIFEATRQAEPRSTWLGPLLGSGAVRYVVAPTSSPRIDGLNQSLPELGYRASLRGDRVYVWEHVGAGRSDHR